MAGVAMTWPVILFSASSVNALGLAVMMNVLPSADRSGGAPRGERLLFNPIATATQEDACLASIVAEGTMQIGPDDQRVSAHRH